MLNLFYLHFLHTAPLPIDLFGAIQSIRTDADIVGLSLFQFFQGDLRTLTPFCTLWLKFFI